MQPRSRTRTFSLLLVHARSPALGCVWPCQPVTVSHTATRLSSAGTSPPSLTPACPLLSVTLLLTLLLLALPCPGNNIWRVGGPELRGRLFDETASLLKSLGHKPDHLPKPVTAA